RHRAHQPDYRGASWPMARRDSLPVAAPTIADFGLRIADWPHPTSRPTNPQSAIANPQSTQDPSLSPEVFTRRLARAQAELQRRKLDFLIATPSTNYEYLTGYNPGRSERLIAIVLPASGKPVVVCPSFEVERIKRHGASADARGWEEQQNPYTLAQDVAREPKPRGTGGIG